MNVLIAPKIDGSLENLTLYFLSGANPSKAFKDGDELKVGDTTTEYGIWNMERGALASFFKMFSSSMYDIDLSLKAPVRGMYYGGHTFFNGFGDKEYSAQKAVIDNKPPVTLEQAQDPHKFPHAFKVITPEHINLNGAELYNNFFDTLRTNRAEISSWHRMTSDNLQTVEFFLAFRLRRRRQAV